MARSEPDSILVISFGGPEGPDDVVPFLRNVTVGRDVPAARLDSVAQRYLERGGRSPINDQNRALVGALRAELGGRGVDVPIHLGNRNWHPMLAETLAAMAGDGLRRAVGVVTSAFSSYPGCRQYREDVARAQAAVGSGAPAVERIRWFHDHPGFIDAVAAATADAIAALASEHAGVAARLVFTAHSIPVAMARTSRYVEQLTAAAERVARRCGAEGWDLVYQSRSGSPQVPWLGPDVSAHLPALAAAGTQAVVVVPLGFVSDHMEVVWDLDVEARQVAADAGLHFARAATPGTDPRFVAALADLVEERILRPATEAACPPGCCPNLAAMAAVSVGRGDTRRGALSPPGRGAPDARSARPHGRAQRRERVPAARASRSGSPWPVIQWRRQRSS